MTKEVIFSEIDKMGKKQDLREETRSLLWDLVSHNGLTRKPQHISPWRPNSFKTWFLSIIVLNLLPIFGHFMEHCSECFLHKYLSALLIILFL